MLDLLIDHPIFIGFKVDSGLRLRLEALSDTDRQYVSQDNSTFLRICRCGDDIYVGKLIHDSLTTDRVDDIRRNVLSILRRIGTEVRVPSQLKILACSPAQPNTPPERG